MSVPVTVLAVLGAIAYLFIGTQACAFTSLWASPENAPRGGNWTQAGLVLLGLFGWPLLLAVRALACVIESVATWLRRIF